jgi:2-methylcitrate dehydratase PrpD
MSSNQAATAVPLAAALSKVVVDLARNGLPEAVRAKTRLHIADALGIGLAARKTDLAKQVEAAERAATGDGPCRLIGGGTASALAAAFANSSFVHILDFDDIHDVGRLHPGTCALPAALAAAGLAPCSDERLVDAVALGTELMARLGALCAPQGDGPGSDWFLTQMFGYLGATVTAGVVMGFDAAQMTSALGLAYMQLAGGKQAGFGTGATSRAIYPAFGTQGGVHATLLERAGVTGPDGGLDGAAGMFRIYLGGLPGKEKLAQLLDFSTWHLLAVDIKPWPSCRLSHPYISVALAARKEGLPAQGEINVAVNASAAKLCRPLPQRLRPQTLQDAKYSVPFMTAYTLLHGEPTLNSLDDRILNDQAVLALAQRVTVTEGLPDNPGHPPAELTLHVEGGSSRHYVFDPASLKLDEQGVRAKFEQCCAYAGRTNEATARAWNAAMQGRIGEALTALE